MREPERSFEKKSSQKSSYFFLDNSVNLRSTLTITEVQIASCDLDYVIRIVLEISRDLSNPARRKINCKHN